MLCYIPQSYFQSPLDYTYFSALNRIFNNMLLISKWNECLNSFVFFQTKNNQMSPKEELSVND